MLYSHIAILWTPRQMKTLSILLIFLTISLTACDELSHLFSTKEQQALENFKNSKIGQEINQCAGVKGVVEWDIFKEPDSDNPNIRVIQASISKNKKHIDVQ
jgi:hypothetical protein